MPKMTIAEQLQHVTCKVSSTSECGTKTATGTGFVYNISRRGDECIPVLVTNRHVVEGFKIISFSMTVEDENDEPDFGNTIPFEASIENWKFHPDPDIDLAMVPIGGGLQQALNAGKKPFFRAINADIIADDNYIKNMDAIENILMIGYPTGLFDETNNLPISRRGITASRIGLPYNGKPEFLIDCACFPGSSGSPIFQFDTGPELTRDGGMSMGGVRFKFLGVLYAGPVYETTGEIRAVPIETAVKHISKTEMMMNLGFCVRATELAGFEVYFSQEIARLEAK